MSKAAWKTALTIAFTAATLWLAIESGALSTLRNVFKEIGPAELFLLGLLFITMRAFQALSLSTVIKQFNILLPFKSSLELAGLKGLYNLGFSGAGLAAQAFHGRSRRLFSIPQLAWATGFQSLLLVSAMGTLLLAAVMVAARHSTIATLLIILGAFAALVPFAIISLIAHPARIPGFIPARLREKLGNLAETGKLLASRKLVLVWLIQTGIVILRLARMIAIVFFLDSQAALGTLAITTLFADLMTVVPLTPGGIGVREFVIGLGADFSGHLDLFISAAIIDRGVAIFGNLVHGFVILVGQLNRRKPD